jgi:hypothetical protein
LYRVIRPLERSIDEFMFKLGEDDERRDEESHPTKLQRDSLRCVHLIHPSASVSRLNTRMDSCTSSTKNV